MIVQTSRKGMMCMNMLVQIGLIIGLVMLPQLSMKINEDPSEKLVLSKTSRLSHKYIMSPSNVNSLLQLKDKPFYATGTVIDKNGNLQQVTSPIDDSQHLLLLHLMDPSVLAGETYTFESKH